ncbi:hypothetical protein QE417_000788 [Mucilaginibacter terrae]|uniref:Uncharacterized protein n=1 Tax=Mucilaginibacter terrae TaxID=1955052 RepID=A0ABU3GPM8_9SPHI|nr:hypothetical protein [Mucilaginibacter terrae]
MFIIGSTNLSDFIKKLLQKLSTGIANNIFFDEMYCKEPRFYIINGVKQNRTGNESVTGCK